MSIKVYIKDCEVREVYLEEVHQWDNREKGCRRISPHYHVDRDDEDWYMPIFGAREEPWGFESPKDAAERIASNEGYEPEDVEDHPFEVADWELSQEDPDYEAVRDAVTYMSVRQRDRLVKKYFPAAYSKEVAERERKRKRDQEAIIKWLLHK